jgi:hypothetical protein
VPDGVERSTRSQIILPIARSGTASTPAIPQIACQKKSEMIASTGFSVKRARLAGFGGLDPAFHPRRGHHPLLFHATLPAAALM